MSLIVKPDETLSDPQTGLTLLRRMGQLMMAFPAGAGRGIVVAFPSADAGRFLFQRAIDMINFVEPKETKETKEVECQPEPSDTSPSESPNSNSAET